MKLKFNFGIGSPWLQWPLAIYQGPSECSVWRIRYLCRASLRAAFPRWTRITDQGLTGLSTASDTDWDDYKSWLDAVQKSSWFWGPGTSQYTRSPPLSAQALRSEPTLPQPLRSCHRTPARRHHPGPCGRLEAHERPTTPWKTTPGCDPPKNNNSFTRSGSKIPEISEQKHSLVLNSSTYHPALEVFFQSKPLWNTQGPKACGCGWMDLKLSCNTPSSHLAQKRNARSREFYMKGPSMCWPVYSKGNIHNCSKLVPKQVCEDESLIWPYPSVSGWIARRPPKQRFTWASGKSLVATPHDFVALCPTGQTHDAYRSESSIPSAKVQLRVLPCVRSGASHGCDHRIPHEYHEW